MNKKLEQLLQVHFRQQPKVENLENLEEAVWQRIRARQGSLFTLWFEDIASVFLEFRFQMASMSFALVVGMTASLAFSSVDTESLFTKEKYNSLALFTMKAPYLPTTLLGNNSRYTQR